MKKPQFQIFFTRLIDNSRLIDDYVMHVDKTTAEKQLAFLIFSKDIFNIRIVKL